MITERMLIVDKMDFQLANSKIGMIEVKNPSPQIRRRFLTLLIPRAKN